MTLLILINDCCDDCVTFHYGCILHDVISENGICLYEEPNRQGRLKNWYRGGDNNIRRLVGYYMLWQIDSRFSHQVVCNGNDDGNVFA